MRKAIITGAAGYIGSVLCKMLKEQGYHVTAVDVNKEVMQCKYADVKINSCFSIMPTGYIDSDSTIFHLAAHSLLGPSAKAPMDYFLNNTVKTLKLLDMMKTRSCSKLIFASTAAVYSEQQRQTTGLFWPGQLTRMYKPVPEDGILDPPNNYGKSKLMSEQMFDSIAPVEKMSIVSFRFFNVIGAYEDVGPSKDTPHIISSLIRDHKNNARFCINGHDYKTKDGTCIRDYVDVKDVCRAMIHADYKLSFLTGHFKYNLGTGRGHSNLQIIKLFSETVGPWYHDLKPKYGSRRVGDPAYLVADPEKFIKETNFSYIFSYDIAKMIRDAWRYHNV